MAKFTSENRGLVLQDENGVYARFVAGEFETDDADVVKRLRAVKDGSVHEAKAAAKSDGKPSDEK